MAVSDVAAAEPSWRPRRSRQRLEISTYSTIHGGLRSCNTALIPGGKGRNTMSNNINERWLSRRELADRLGLPVKTLAQWASKGAGPRYARMGRHVRYRVSDVVEWEAAQLKDRCKAVLVGRSERDPGEVTPPPRGMQTSEALGGVGDDPHHL